MRFELLGLRVTPQHSDCRIMDQLAYKCAHSRPIIAKVLFEKYSDLADSGWQVSRAEIQRDAQGLLWGEFERFISGTLNQASSWRSTNGRIPPWR